MIAKEDGDGLNFERGVGVEIGDVDWNILDVVMDEESETATTAIRAVAADDGVVGERRVGLRAKFCLLKTRNLDVVVFEVDFEFGFGGVEAIAVELEEA